MDKREKGVKEGRINVADSPCNGTVFFLPISVLA